MKTENPTDGDILMQPKTESIIEVSSGAPTPRGLPKPLSHDDAQSVPDSIASSTKVGYPLDLFVF